MCPFYSNLIYFTHYSPEQPLQVSPWPAVAPQPSLLSKLSRTEGGVGGMKFLPTRGGMAADQGEQRGDGGGAGVSPLSSKLEMLLKRAIRDPPREAGGDLD